MEPREVRLPSALADRLDTGWLRRRHPEIAPDAPTTTVLRCCMLKQEHAGVARELAAALAEHLSAN